jgi:carboxyl-terminal processing protease
MAKHLPPLTSLLVWVLLTASLMTGCFAQKEENPNNSSLQNSTPTLSASNSSSSAESPSKNPPPSREVFQKAAELIARFLQEQHFAKHPLDQNTSKEWIGAYMKLLDYNHLFFLHSDLVDFEKKYSSSLGRGITKGDLTPAFEIMDIFQQRLNNRLNWVTKRMDQPFDFSGQDYYTPDRSKSSWPATPAEADTLWEQKIKYDLLAERLAEKKEVNPHERLKKRYNQLRKNFEETDEEEIIQNYLSALTSLYDPHSQYLGPSALEDFGIAMNLSLFGIGAVLTTEEGYCTIKEIIPGGPADLDKRLKVNDRIVAVAQGNKEFTDIVDMKLRHAVRLIRGEKGSLVRLSVIPASADSSIRNEVKLIRDEVKITSQKAKAKLIEQKNPAGETLRLGVIDIPSFYGPINEKKSSDSQSSTGTTDDVRVLIEKLQEKKIDGLVLDLRSNGGGLLGEAVRLVGLFIDTGPVVQIKDPQGRIQKLEDQERGTLYNGPLIILTNKLSASASEIAAGALQNYGRAVIVGDSSTHGKGTVQTVTEINNFILPIFGKKPEAGALKLTIQKFYLPNGHSTQNRGVVPDIILPSINTYLELGEDKLPHALPWDEIPPTTYSVINPDLRTTLTKLTQNSKSRIEKDEDFKLLLEDIERIKKRLEDKKVSLNEAERKTEKETEKKRTDQRKQHIKQLSQNSPPILHITFENLEGSFDAPKITGSRARLLEDEDQSEENKNEAEPTPAETFTADLHLREALRILADTISLQTPSSPQASLSPAK